MKKTVRRVLIVVLVVLVLVTVAGFVAGNFFYELALDPTSDKTTVLEAEGNEVDIDAEREEGWRQDLEWFDGAGPALRTIQSFDGLALSAYVLENEDPEANWVVIFHGYNSAARVMAESARDFYARGYSLLMPDARGCGKSEGAYMGMGWHDRLDALGWLALINGEYAPENIVLYGVSMGGATVLMASGEALPANVRAIVADCAYTSVSAEFAYQANQLFGIPSFPIVNFTSAVTRIRAGFWLEEASALAQVQKSQTPTLFIHGAEDAFVPAFMSRELYDAASCEKELVVVEAAGHGGASAADPALYWGAIDAFLAGRVA